MFDNLTTQQLIVKQRNAEIRQQVAHANFVATIRRNHQLPRIYAPLLARMGKLLSDTGSALQHRYGQQADAARWTPARQSPAS